MTELLSRPLLFPFALLLGLAAIERMPASWAYAAEEKLPAKAGEAAPSIETAKESDAVARAKETVKLLASDAFEGRGPGTKGIDLAADYIAGEFQKLGLKTSLYDGAPFQKFTMNTGAELGKKNQLAVVGPPGPDGKPRRFELKLGVDYTPLSLGGSGKIDVPLVFAGYGITATESLQPGDAHAAHGGVAPHDPHAAPAAKKPNSEPAKKSESQPEKPATEKPAVAKPTAEKAKAEPAVAAAAPKDPHAAPADPHTVPAKLEEKVVYDDYAGLDVKGKCVIVLRHQPQQGNPHGILPGIPNSPHAPFTRKLANAYEHGASAVIFITSDYDARNRLEMRRKQWQETVDELAELREKFKKEKKPTAEQQSQYREDIEELAQQILDHGKKLEQERDALLDFRAAGGSGDPARLPAMHARRSVWDRIFADAGKPSLESIEKKIDDKVAPDSFPLDGWRVVGEVDVIRTEAEVKNVVGVLEGDGPHADETIVIGAHYDHLGFGGEGSFVPALREIHNGADDNASGITALLEIARILTSREKKPARRIVFIAFTAEERGLIGSARYVKEPLYPMDKTVAMLNLDMVGRLTDEKLIIQGGDTAEEFTKLIDQLNADKYKFKITHNGGGFGPSDHSSFYAKQVPVMHFFTGLHSDYHRPSDDFDKVNAAGLVRVAELVADTATALADAPARPKYLESKSTGPTMNRGGDRPYFGSIPDFAQSEPGYGISGVTKSSPADKGGLKGGDVIIKFGQDKVTNLDDFDAALRRFKAGDKVPVVVKREGKEVTLQVVLGSPR
ncbi:MAG: hypothetical protein C0483_09475 [Pirellula sp.]|nr:hypothetical protein [Pirellula sp.]